MKNTLLPMICNTDPTAHQEITSCRIDLPYTILFFIVSQVFLTYGSFLGDFLVLLSPPHWERIIYGRPLPISSILIAVPQRRTPPWWWAKESNPGPRYYAAVLRIRIRRMFMGPLGSGSGSISTRFGSGSGFFYHQAKIVRKTLISTVLWPLSGFYLWKMI